MRAYGTDERIEATNKAEKDKIAKQENVRVVAIIPC